jgi:3-hydroxyisobutyrate dehydrogenase-like beta-hydroxyacid dehydrogenase
MRVALLGTGKMGAPIARRLAAAGHELTLWNRTLEKARSLGVGRVQESPEAAAAGAEVVLSILTDARAVRDVYAALEPGQAQVFVEMSTAGPDVLDELVERFAHLVAAPIVGSVPAIEQGKALILAGGEASDVERVKPVLVAFGEPQYVGSRREAAGLKLLNNAMLALWSAGAAELMVAAGHAGLEREAAFGLLQRQIPYLQARKPSYVEGRHTPAMFFLRDMVKDLDLALDLFHGAGASTPGLGLTRELYAAAVPEHGDAELSAVIERFP